MRSDRVTFACLPGKTLPVVFRRLFLPATLTIRKHKILVGVRVALSFIAYRLESLDIRKFIRLRERVKGNWAESDKLVLCRLPRLQMSLFNRSGVIRAFLFTRRRRPFRPPLQDAYTPPGFVEHLMKAAGLKSTLPARSGICKKAPVRPSRDALETMQLGRKVTEAYP